VHCRQAAIDSGADCGYIGARDHTNARTVADLSFDAGQAQEGVRCARTPRRGTELELAIKNALDAVEWSPASLLAALRQAFSAPHA
jgi:hypothetical protein